MQVIYQATFFCHFCISVRPCTYHITPLCLTNSLYASKHFTHLQLLLPNPNQSYLIAFYLLLTSIVITIWEMNRSYYESHPAMHKSSYATPPPSYATYAPRSQPRSTKSRGTKQRDEGPSTKRLIFRGFQLLSLALCAYRLYEKHSQKDDAGSNREHTQSKKTRSRSHRESRNRSASNARGVYDETIIGTTSTIAGSDSDYMNQSGSGAGRRSRREREMAGRRIEYRP
jgi:hypothetical protein